MRGVTDILFAALWAILGLPAGARTLADDKSRTRWLSAVIATTFWFFGALFVYYRTMLKTWPGKTAP